MATPSYVLEVLNVIQETADAHSVVLGVPKDVKDAFAYSPGQFLTIAVPSRLTEVVARCYSLSSSPFENESLVITVKRTPDGFASNWICDNIREGNTLRVLPPSGIFSPASLSADLLLFAGGSGITPIMSIIRSALAHGTGEIVLFYANRDRPSTIFFEELDALTAENSDRLTIRHWHEQVDGLPVQQQLEDFAGPFQSYDAFVCGPAPFMQAAASALKALGFPRERLHREKFVSLGGNPFRDL